MFEAEDVLYLKCDESVTLKSQAIFAAIMRTPLALIQSQSQVLQAELDDPRLDPRFDMLARNGRRLLELVNQVLDLSNIGRRISQAIKQTEH
ncbi:MAG: hypothetical protein D6722_11175 [Bacteroidetes bacterium]|nr:MAG: hypothetical protein D6722_11175 [Bacteroidota bacterium]